MPSRVHSVFLSHSSRDKSFVRRLADDLRREGIQVWFDETDLRVGAHLSAIEARVREAQFFVVVKSLAAMGSPWVAREIQIAREVGTIRVLPAVLEDTPYAGVPGLEEIAIADFRTSYRRGLWSLVATITGRSDPLFTAKEAAEEIKRRTAVSGELFGLSQQGVGTLYNLANAADWLFADASEGRSRSWIAEFYDRRLRAIQPFALINRRIHELPVLELLESSAQPESDSVVVMSCTLNHLFKSERAEDGALALSEEARRVSKRYTHYRPVPLFRPFIDSDLAVTLALESPEARRSLQGRLEQLFTLVKLEADRFHGNSVLWKVSFFDTTLAESVLTVGVDAVAAKVRYPAMRAEALNTNLMHLHTKDGEIIISIANQLRALKDRSLNSGLPGSSGLSRLTAADALRLTKGALATDADRWQLAFLSNTGVIKTAVARHQGSAFDRLLRVDGTAGQWVVEMCSLEPTPVTDGERSGFRYDFAYALVTPEEGAEVVDNGSTLAFPVPLSRCPLPPSFLEAYESALALALRAVSVDFEILSVAHTRSPEGLRWYFRFYDQSDIVAKVIVSGDGRRVVSPHGD